MAFEAILIGKIVGQKVSYDEQTQRDINTIVKMLDGSFDIDSDIPKKRGMPGPEQMKMLW